MKATLIITIAIIAVSAIYFATRKKTVAPLPGAQPDEGPQPGDSMYSSSGIRLNGTSQPGTQTQPGADTINSDGGTYGTYVGPTAQPNILTQLIPENPILPTNSPQATDPVLTIDPGNTGTPVDTYVAQPTATPTAEQLIEANPDLSPAKAAFLENLYATRAEAEMVNQNEPLPVPATPVILSPIQLMEDTYVEPITPQAAVGAGVVSETIEYHVGDRTIAEMISSEANIQ